MDRLVKKGNEVRKVEKSSGASYCPLVAKLTSEKLICHSL